MIKKSILTVFLVLVQTVVFAVTKTYNATSGNWSTAANWSPIGVPGPNDDVIVVSGSNITLDVNIIIGNGTYTFNGNVTDNGTHTLTATTNGGKLLISNNSTTTFGGIASWDNSTVTVNAGSSLIVGSLAIANGTQITIEGSLIVNGDLTDNNNGGSGSFFVVTGYVQVYGNYSAPVGSVSVSGAGVFQTTGTIITTGSSTVGGSTNNCTTGPCSSGSIICGDGINSYVSSVSPTNQVLCSGQTILPISFVTNSTGTLTYQWQISTTNGGTGFININGANSNSYSPPQPSVTTWYRVVYSSTTTGCANLISPSSKISLSNNTPPVAGTIAGGNVSYCSNTNSTLMTLSGYTGTGFQWQSSADNSVFTNISGATSASFIAANVTATTYYRTIVSNGLCNTVNSSSVAINKVSTQSAPTVGTRTQPTCAVATGSVVLNGLPASGTWTLTRSPGGVTTSGTGTSTTISGLAAGNYTYTVTNASGCISPASANVGINAFVAEINTWNANAWSTGSPPPMVNGTQIIVFNSPFISSTDLSGCSCEVNNDVLIKSGHTLTVTNELKVASGDMVFESGSSLVQKNDNVVNSNTGIIKYQRIARSLNTDYTYWSSPVSNQTLVGLIPTALAGTSYSYEQTATSENWVNAAGSTPMAPGKGYIIRGREGTQTIPKLNDVEFAGIPNNGPYSISPIYLDKSYLLGNPYPSAISADMFLAANAGVLNGTLYFWTHNTPIQAANAGDPTLGSGAYAYTSNDYATYNATGGVGAAPPDTGAATGPAPSGSTVSGANNSTPNGYISAGQGFFASTIVSLSGSSIVFNNNMRVAGGTTLLDGSIVNDQFFKSRDPKKIPKNTIEKNRIWLNLTNKQGAFKQTLIGYISEATNEYDSRFDGKSYDGNEFVDFYSVNQDKNLVIQGRALPFDENDEVPLGFRTTINGAFTINIDQVDGFLTNQAVFIEDKLTNTVFDLKSGNYTFNTIAGTFEDRFVLRFKDNTTDKTLAAAYFDSLEKTVLVSNKNKQIRIDSAVERIDKVTVFDLLGRQIYQKTNVNSNELSITNLVISHQTLIVKTTLQNGNAVTRKIIY